MQTLSIDIETYSDVNLSKCGVYKYAESPDFEILLFGYSSDGSEVTVIDLAQGERLPQEIIDALTDDTVIKWAFNANFERVCLSRYLRDLGVSLDGQNLYSDGDRGHRGNKHRNEPLPLLDALHRRREQRRYRRSLLE